MKRYTPTLEAYSWADDDATVDAQPVMQVSTEGCWVRLDDIGPTYRVSDGNSLAETGTLGALLPMLLDQTRLCLDDLRVILALGVDGAHAVRTREDVWLRVTRAS